MGLFGHDRAAVLDGGLPKWRAEGRPVETGTAAPATRGTFRPDFRATRLRGIGDMLANLETGKALVLDARAAGRFTAEVPEPRAGMRSGHIPGSRNLPYTQLLAPDQTLLPPEQLKARLAEAGVDGAREIITSCGSGVTATILTLAMVRAGLPPGAVYDGSWTEWGGRADTPVETKA
jgi:thiosulfate/3-mercaptopyruvate sulfurtransferase